MLEETRVSRLKINMIECFNESLCKWTDYKCIHLEDYWLGGSPNWIYNLQNLSKCHWKTEVDFQEPTTQTALNACVWWYLYIFIFLLWLIHRMPTYKFTNVVFIYWSIFSFLFVLWVCIILLTFCRCFVKWGSILMIDYIKSSYYSVMCFCSM